MRLRRFIVTAATACAVTAALGLAALSGLRALDLACPPPLDPPPLSAEVLDRDGNLLRTYAASDHAWRLPVQLDKVDPHFIDMLIAYEDKRFKEHRGIDPLAVLRAAGQLVSHGRIVSGGSTITMQLARLMEPRASRSFAAKLKQALRAIQIERRWSKDEILERYLTLAPYGGNLEGIRAASLAWFGKEPNRFTLAEAALLVALPQAPESRRPDRHAANADAARDRVLGRMVEAGLMDVAEAERVMQVALPAAGRREMPALAPHAADRALAAAPAQQSIRLTLRRSVQEGLEAVARDAARKLGPKVSLAMVMADARTGEIVGEVGSADFFSSRRSGWIDMTRRIRSPGSTLKPFIYGLAFEEGLVAQSTLIEDSPASFGGYRPRNFDMDYMGDVSVRNALQLSLNVPAIRLLDAVGPVRMTSRMALSGVVPTLPAGERPGLAIGLGGVGLSLHDLVQLYTALPNQGFASRLHDQAAKPVSSPLLDPAAAWQVTDILSGVRPPIGAPKLAIGYKTGTSYGYRDAWSVGFDGRHVLGIWVGRPDGGPVPGISGFATAAPILFDAFSRSGVSLTAFAPPPRGTARIRRDDLPVPMRRFTSPSSPLTSTSVTEAPPTIVFPPQDARLDLMASTGNDPEKLTIKLQGGRAPFRWLANGRPLDERSRRRSAMWQPDGEGFSTLTVIDAAGRAASVRVFVE